MTWGDAERTALCALYWAVLDELEDLSWPRQPRFDGLRNKPYESLTNEIERYGMAIVFCRIEDLAEFAKTRDDSTLKNYDPSPEEAEVRFRTWLALR